jgi:hypothetical protein
MKRGAETAGKMEGLFGNLDKRLEQLKAKLEASKGEEDQECFNALGNLRKVARHRDGNRHGRQAALIQMLGTITDSWPSAWADEGNPQEAHVTYLNTLCDAIVAIKKLGSAKEIADVYDKAVTSKPTSLDTKVTTFATLAFKGYVEEYLLAVALQAVRKERTRPAMIDPTKLQEK